MDFPIALRKLSAALESGLTISSAHGFPPSPFPLYNIPASCVQPDLHYREPSACGRLSQLLSKDFDTYL